MGARALTGSTRFRQVVRRALLSSLLVLGASWPVSADPSARSGTPAKGAWFLYDLGGERQVRIDYLGPAMGQDYVARTFLSGQNDGHVDVHLAPRSLLGCADWPPAAGVSGTCRVKRSVGARDYWTDVTYRVHAASEIKVPAGRFDALRIDVRLRTEGERVESRPMREVWWYVPRLNWPVRYNFARNGATAVLIDYGVALPARTRRQASDAGPKPSPRLRDGQ